MAREAREVLIRDLLRDNWDASNTSGLQPDIKFGWWDDHDDSTPLVTPQRGDEGPTDGGQTGYSTIDPGGGSPGQTIVGVVPVHIFTGRDSLSGASTSHQRVYNQLVTEEIRRIVKANANRPSNPSSGNTPVQGIAPGQTEEVPEPEKRGVFHELRTVGYWYHDD